MEQKWRGVRRVSPVGIVEGCRMGLTVDAIYENGIFRIIATLSVNSRLL
jgi:hypothetical protein